MKYTQQVEDLYSKNRGFRAILEAFQNLTRRPRVLIFSHHDLDGIASAFILKRVLERIKGAETVVRMPQHFKLWEETLVDELKRSGPFDMLVISDKGTFASYDRLLKHINPVIIIDHHQLDGEPKECLLFNPTVQNTEYASSSALLCHMMAFKLGSVDEYDDFAALIGCRGDFAFDPVEKTALEFTKPFLERVRLRFPNLLEVRSGRPTMYDIVDRMRTSLINQIGEVLQAGTIAHFYRETLKINVDSGPRLVLEFLLELAGRRANLREVRSVREFLGTESKGMVLGAVFEQYKEDWNLLESRAENAVYLGEIRGVGIYLIFAREAKAMEKAPFPAILPFVASTKLESLKRKGGHPHAAVIVFCPKERGVHISMRGGGGIINCGKICFEIARRLQNRYPEYSGIGGGGHARAAELLADKPVPMYAVMHELLFAIEEMMDLASALDRGEITQEKQKLAEAFGLE